MHVNVRNRVQKRDLQSHECKQEPVVKINCEVSPPQLVRQATAVGDRPNVVGIYIQMSPTEQHL